MNPNFFSAVLFGTTFFSQFCLAQSPSYIGSPENLSQVVSNVQISPPKTDIVNIWGEPDYLFTAFRDLRFTTSLYVPPEDVIFMYRNARIDRVEPLSAGGYSGQITAVGNSNGSNNLGESGIGQLKLTLLANGTYTGSARFLGRRISFKGVAGAVGATTVAKVTSKASRAVTVQVTPLPDGYANLKIRVKDTTYSGQVILQ
jgi:hypothetical protein